MGFQTAGKSKPLEVSDTALQKASSILSKPAAVDVVPASSSSAGFQTAGKSKSLEISDAALQKSSGIFSKAAAVAPDGSINPVSKPMGFQTAGKDNPIAVSDAALQHGNIILTKPAAVNRATASASSVGFQTAGKSKPLEVSDTLQKASSILSKAADVAPDGSNNPVSKPMGFQTAGKNNPIAVSAAALQHGNIILTKPAAADLAPVSSGPGGFQTAGKSKPLQVSDTTLQKATSILTKPAEVDVAPVSSGSVGFQTAGKSKPLEVSDAALQKASSILSKAAVVAPGGSSNPVPKPMGFQTAGKSNPIAVSDAALQQAGSILSKPATSPALNSKPTAHAIGFQTAGAKSNIRVSKEALLQGVKILSKPVVSMGSTQHQKAQSAASAGFETAGSGSKVLVSETSLVAAACLLEDQDPHREHGNRTADVTSKASFSGGFETAGKSIPIILSGDTLDKAGELFSCPRFVEHENGNADTRGSHIAEETPTRRETADVSMLRVKEDLVDESRRGGGADTSSSAFETAGKSKQVTIADDAPQRANDFLSDYRIDSSDEASDFQVAGNVRDLNSANIDGDFHLSNERVRKKPRVSDIGIRNSSALFRELQTYPSHADETVMKATSSRIRFAVSKPANIDGRLFEPEACATANAVEGHFLGLTPCRERAEAATVTMSAGIRKLHPHDPNSRDGNLSPVPIRLDIADTSRSDLGVQVDIDYDNDEMDGITHKLPTGQRLERFINTAIEGNSWDSITSKLKSSMNTRAMTNSPSKCRRDGVQHVTLLVDSVNAVNLCFASSTDNPGNTLPVSFCEEASDHPSDLRGMVEDLSIALVAKGCKKEIISDKWVRNHKRWIVWKLASYERRFSSLFGGNLLTYDALLSQLHMRYYKEFRDGKRSALRVCLNKDMAASTMMILCVSQVFKHSVDEPKVANKTDIDSESKVVSSSKTFYTMELTDGWYSVHAAPDEHMCELIQRGRICVGNKLMVSNATLVGTDDGIDPLDDEYSPEKKGCKVFFRIWSNSTRLAKWNANLGFVPSHHQLRDENGLFRVKRINDIISGGGIIPLLHFSVSRRYPLMFLRRKSTEQDGETISEAEEYRQRAEFERRKLIMIERFTDEVEAECTKVRSSLS